MSKVSLTLSDKGRSERDFYATPPDATRALFEYLELPPTVIWEPACGDGRICKVAEEFGHDFIASDIQTDFGDTADFLTTPQKQSDVLITNPPFYLAADFINHARGLGVGLFAFLLKSQFWHAKKRLPLFRDTRPSHILALSFRLDFDFGKKGGSPVMECLWTVWDNSRQGGTIYDILEKPQAGNHGGHNDN
jgi:hypothetical protein